MLSHQGVTPGVQSLAVYDGKLYAGHGEDWNEDDGDIFVYDGTNWSLSYDGPEVAITALAVYNGRLYAGQYGWDAGDGDILVFDGSSWTLAYDAPSEEGVSSLAVHNAKLYAGTLWSGDILVFDGSSWKHEFRTEKTMIAAMAEYDGRLYAATGGIQGGSGEGDIYVKEGGTWQFSYDGEYNGFTSLAVYGGKLYAGQSDWSSGAGDVFVYDGSSWGVSFQGPYDGAASLALYKGRLYAGLGNDNDDSEGDIYSFDGESWKLAFDGGKVAIRALAVYGDSLYAGQYGWNEPEGAVYRLSQPAVPVMTGTDGTTGAETLSVALDLAASRNTATCGGASPCSATNQVKFTATDRAGNVAIYGPYAVIAASAASGADIVAGRSSGTWHNTPLFPFQSAFTGAAYYRYAWDTSPSMTWAGTEPLWTPSSATLMFSAASEGTDHYFHARPYNIFDAPGPGVDLGPFRYETARPAAAAFASVSSTGGYMSESQTNDLAAGVQVRLTVQDALSGLSVSSAAPHGDGPVPARGYSVRYTNDAGVSWVSLSASQSFLGPGPGVSSLAAHDGKLYAGLGEDDTEGDGDIYVYDGNIWTLSLNGTKVAITCLAEYGGKLYAGQYGYGYGDGVVYVLDGQEWKVAYNHPLAVAVRALAVYNGRLYAGMYGWWGNDEGDVYVFDGKSWSKSFDGSTEGIASLAVYNGRLYAGEGFWDSPGDGNIRVFDGNSWRLSYDGPAQTARSLAVYDGRLYAGFYGAAGDADIYVHDGAAWTRSYDGEVDGITALAVYGGKLYAGIGEYGFPGDGDVLSFDGSSWSLEYDGDYEAVRAFAVYGGDLYIGEWYGGYSTSRVKRLTQPALPALTGADGAQGQETLSAVLDLKASTNTETCGGAAPCGATNQVVFTYTDTAGNAKVSGPYAVIAAPPLSADDVTPLRSTGVWYHTSTFSFTSAQVSAAYYRYVWDNSAAYVWTYTEPVWSGAQLDVNGLSSAATWYLHLLPYDSGGSYGPAREIGPFLYDGVAPAPSAFTTYNSTGGALPEPRFNNLRAGVTAQIELWEGLSGLSLRYYAPGQDGLSAADRGFENGSLPAQFTTGGDAPWFVAGGTVAAGNFSARSGDIYNDAQSYLHFTADTVEGEFSFYAMTDTEVCCDHLRFSIDGVEVSSTSGLASWNRYSFPIAAGRHTFMWSYTKDLWDSELSDTVWIDQVEFPSTATVQVQYSTSSGNSWLPVQSTVPAVSPYFSLTGFDGTLSTQTFKVYNLPLEVSTNAAVCGGQPSCDATNQVRFFAADKAGNLMTAGPYAVLVDTSPTAPIADLSTAAVFDSSATLSWTAPLDIGPGLAGVTTGWYRVDYATYSGYGFSSATFKAEIATAAVIGSVQSLDISPLWPHTTYYAMVYAGDRAYNFTAASNLLTIPPKVPAVYCGLKTGDDAQVVILGCEPQGTVTSHLRVSRYGVTFGVLLVDPADPAASRIKFKTPEGIKAVRKY